MKKLFLIISIVIIAGSVFVGCEKESSNQETKNLQDLNFDMIDDYSDDISNFHYYFMDKYIRNLNHTNNAPLNSLLKDELSKFDFKNIHITNETYYYIDNYTNDNINKLINELVSKNFSFNTLMIDYNLANIDTTLLSLILKEIDANFMNILTQSTSEYDFMNTYKKFVTNKLSTLREPQKKFEYICAKFFADIYLSSFDYVTEYYFSTDSKGKKWENFKGMVKEAWNNVKPIVYADAAGAVIGAIEGAAAGPEGIVAVGMVEACKGSAYASAAVIASNH